MPSSSGPVVVPEYAAPRTGLDDPIGETDTCGTTWYDEQQYTTCGRQIAVDPEGFAHHVWTNGLASGSSQRHVYYNVWDPETAAFNLPDPGNAVGVAVESAQRAGYANVTVNAQGFAFPAFHQTAQGASVPHAAVAIDFLPRLGAFYVQEIPFPEDRRIIYPKITVDRTGDLHVTATHGLPYNMGFYAKGHPYFSNDMGDSIGWGGGFASADSTYFLTRDIAASLRSSRVAMAWLFFDSRAWLGVNLFLTTSSDGGATWAPPLNITDYPALDTNCVANGGAVDVCNQDTLRPAVDLSLVFDQNDVVHIAFTARGFYYWDEGGTVGPWIHVDGVSSIWHWDEQNLEFNIVAERPYGTLTHSVGHAQAMCQRPGLAVDTLTGYLYCSYQMYDTTQWSEAGYQQSDAWVSVSTTGGRTWSAGTNVTATDGGQNAPAGASRSERDISVAPFVSGGMMHMQYQLDLDAGTAINSSPEGVPTRNPIIYQRIPVSQIPPRPLINPYRVLRLDSTGYPFGLDTTVAVFPRPAPHPAGFALYQNYPNPFNPQTHIQFDVQADTRVTLKVYDVLGREAAVLFDQALLTAGAHVVPFDASALASGVYIYRLSVAGHSQSRKMILMR